jgi:hypothetical protein
MLARWLTHWQVEWNREYGELADDIDRALDAERQRVWEAAATTCEQTSQRVGDDYYDGVPWQIVCHNLAILFRERAAEARRE